MTNEQKKARTGCLSQASKMKGGVVLDACLFAIPSMRSALRQSTRALSPRVFLAISALLALCVMTACAQQSSEVDPSALPIKTPAVTSPSLPMKTPAAASSSLPTIPPELAKYVARNLIINGDAEAGPAGTSEQPIVKDIPGWTRTGSLTVLAYTAGQTIGGVGAGDPRPEDHGNNFFAGGPNGGPNALSTATETIDLTGLAAVTDTGKLHYILSGYLGGWGSYSNQAEVSVQFLKSDHQDVGTSAHIGPVTSGDNHQPDKGTGLWKRTTSSTFPVVTRYLKVTLTISVDPNSRTAADNSANSGFADSISFVLNP